MISEELSPELQAKAKACTSPEELKALAESEGFELSDDALQGVAGGAGLIGCKDYGCSHDTCSIDQCGDLNACYDYTCAKATNCPSLNCSSYNCTELD